MNKLCRIRKRGGVSPWLCAALLAALCGCRSARPAVSQTPDTPPSPPVLAPMPDYPEERSGWDTNAVVAVFASPNDARGLTVLKDALTDALRQHGYRVVDGMDSLKVKGPPYVDTDWLAAEWRRQAKLLIVTGTRTWGSAAFQGQINTDMCMQILAADHPYDGFGLSLAVPRIRTFHVWSRASHSEKTTWDQAYLLHAPLLAGNLMRMPGFRAALERKPSALAASLCPPPERAPASAVAADAVAAPAVPGTSGADDRATAERLVGAWEGRVASRVKTTGNGQPGDESTTETTSRTVFRADGRFTRETRMGSDSAKTSEGIWEVRRGLLCTEVTVDAGGRRMKVPCEYDLAWEGDDAVMFRMTPDGYQGTLRAGGGDAMGRCWYDPADVLHTTVTVGGFSVESESKLESARRVGP